MNDFQSRFQSNAEKTGIVLGTNEGLLLAVSGGVDSMVLLELCYSLGISCTVAHCNFQLRGEESDGDEMLVKERAGEWGIPFFSKRFDTLDYAGSKGVSVQVAARDLRYQWFLELSGILNISKVATAHHLNDHAETAIINWVRGTGITGLSGIPAVTVRGGGQLIVLRPLLSFTKTEILEYAKEKKLTWREDSSNAKADYTRNFIRQQVIPLLEEVQPGFLYTFERSAAYLSETSANYLYLLQQSIGFQPLQENTLQMNIAALQQLPAPVSALRELLKPYGFTPEQARQVATHLDKTGLDIFSGSRNRLTVDRGRIILEIGDGNTVPLQVLFISPDDLMVRVPNGLRLFFTPTTTHEGFPDGRNAVIVDADKLIYPLQLRTWQAGDTFCPFGMDGKSRKVQDFLTDLKVSKPAKERTLMLINGNNEIIWVVGFRLDNRYFVAKTTENCLKISCIR